MKSPTPQQVTELRESVRASRNVGITAAQDACAEIVHAGRRSWQQWERGDRKMHPAFWELAQIKLDSPAK